MKYTQIFLCALRAQFLNILKKCLLFSRAPRANSLSFTMKRPPLDTFCPKLRAARRGACPLHSTAIIKRTVAAVGETPMRHCRRGKEQVQRKISEVELRCGKVVKKCLWNVRGLSQFWITPRVPPERLMGASRTTSLVPSGCVLRAFLLGASWVAFWVVAP